MLNTAINPFENLDSFLRTFAGDMAARVSTGMVPLFNPETDALSAEVRSLAQCGMTPFPAQAVATEGLLRGFEHEDNMWLIGEMGTGKTCMGAWELDVLMKRAGSPMRCAVTAPNQLVKKWRKHFLRIIPGCKAVIINNFRDLTKMLQRCQVDKRVNDGRVLQKCSRWLSPTVPEIWIFPRDKGKLGYAWSAGVQVRKKPIKFKTQSQELQNLIGMQYHCPRCGEVVKDDEGKEATIEFFAKRDKLKNKRFCRHPTERGSVTLTDDKGVKTRVCGERLWQAFNGQRSKHVLPWLPIPGVSPRRMAPCQYLRRQGFVFDFYIADEMHELKGEASLQGQMFADFCVMARRRLLLTGTLSGGYADNLLYLMWRTSARRLIADGLTYGHKGHDEYVKIYGVLQTRRRYVAQKAQDYSDLVQGRGKLVSANTKSLPGISPVLFVNHLLGNCVFIRLREMHAHLPKFTERVHSLPLSDDQDKALFKMQEAFNEHCERMRASGEPCRAWAAARSVFLRWPDKPWMDSYIVYDFNRDGIPIPVFRVPTLPQREYVKELRVRRIVRRNMLRGRKTWIFTELSGLDSTPTWDWMDYLRDYLRSHGIRAEVLRSNGSGGPKPEDREEWIERTEQGVDCVISHPALVKTGLDLFAFPSICFAYCGDNTYTLRQASRRSWRLGQTMECEVDYLVSKGSTSKSAQDAALSLMARKMESALAIEGDFSGEGLAALSSAQEDVGSQLAKFISGQLDGLDPATTAFDRYRKKLEACMPSMGSGLQVAPPPVQAPTPRFETSIFPTTPASRVRHVPLEVPPPVRQPEPEPVFSAMRALGETSEAARMFERPTLVQPSGEPDSLRERKRLRLKALEQALSCDAEEVDGDMVCIDSQWYQLVAKARVTVRARNFEVIHQRHGDAIIAFVEPINEAGPSTSSAKVTVEGIEYLVSMMTVERYMAGERVPGHDLLEV